MKFVKEDVIDKNRVIIFYLLLLINHVAHVLEEIWGRFWILDKVGTGFYLTINWVLFCIPVILFYFVLLNNLRAYKLGIVYAVFMALQGIGHNMVTIITGKYFDGYAGGYSDIGLIIIGTLLIYYLLKGLKYKGITGLKT